MAVENVNYSLLSSLDFSINRGSSSVLLNRKNGVIGPTGLYHCNVLDARNVVQSVYIGLYPFDQGQLKNTYVATCCPFFCKKLEWCHVDVYATCLGILKLYNSWCL